MTLHGVHALRIAPLFLMEEDVASRQEPKREHNVRLNWTRRLWRDSVGRLTAGGDLFVQKKRAGDLPGTLFFSPLPAHRFGG